MGSSCQPRPPYQPNANADEGSFLCPAALPLWFFSLLFLAFEFGCKNMRCFHCSSMPSGADRDGNVNGSGKLRSGRTTLSPMAGRDRMEYTATCGVSKMVPRRRLLFHERQPSLSDISDEVRCASPHPVTSRSCKAARPCSPRPCALRPPTLPGPAPATSRARGSRRLGCLRFWCCLARLGRILDEGHVCSPTARNVSARLCGRPEGPSVVLT